MATKIRDNLVSPTEKPRRFPPASPESHRYGTDDETPKSLRACARAMGHKLSEKTRWETASHFVPPYCMYVWGSFFFGKGAG